MTLKFYDIETFPNLFLIVGKPEDSQTFEVLINPNFSQVVGFISDGTTLVGFNNHHYDDLVISAMLTRCQMERLPNNIPIPPDWVKDFSDRLIAKEIDEYCSGLDQPTEDVMRYRDFETNSLNLKSFESMLGMQIVETPRDFALPVPEDQWVQVIDYCKNDVVATQNAYQYLKDKGAVGAVESLRAFVAASTNDSIERLTKLSTNSLMIRLLGEAKYDRSKLFEYLKRCNFDHALADPAFKRWFDKIVNWVDDPFKLDKPVLEFERNGVDYKFGLGGGHGANQKTIFHDCIDVDFASLYPNIIINLEGLGPKTTQKYAELVELRVASKKTDKVLAQGLKLFINSLYGLTRSKKSGAQIYDEHLGLDVCIVGQVMLYDLALRLEECGAELVNINTDGIIYDPANTDPDAIDEVWEQFSKRVNIQLDSDVLPWFFAKDVNNYFVLNETGGPIKKKGIFAAKPYSNNQVVADMVINWYSAHVNPQINLSCLKDQWEIDPGKFTLRAKSNKNFEFSLGMLECEPRFGKRGQRLKHDEEIYTPLTTIGHQFRGWPVTDGWDMRVFNKNTGKFVHNSTLKTAKTNAQFVINKPKFEELDLEYYDQSIDEIIERIGVV